MASVNSIGDNKELPYPVTSKQSVKSVFVKPTVGFAIENESLVSFKSDSQTLDENVIPEDDSLWRHDHTFEKLREIYLHTMDDLQFSESKGVNLEPVKVLFKTLWEGLETSHENLIRLSNKDHGMSGDLATKMAQCKTLMKLAEDDPIMSQNLKTKLENAWRLTDAGETEEKANILKINTLKDELFILNRSIQAAAKTEGQDTIKELSKIKMKLENDKTAISSDAAKIHTAYELVKFRREQNAELKIELSERIEMLQREAIIQQESITKETKRKEQLEQKILETNKNVYLKTQAMVDMDRNLDEARFRLSEAERSVREQKLVNEEAQRDMEISNNKYEKLRVDYDNQTRLCERLTHDLQKRQADLREKEEEITQIRQDITRANRQHILQQRKVTETQTDYNKIEVEREILRGKLIVLEKELELIQKKMDENKKKVEELDKERSLINRNLQRAAAITSEHISTSKTHEVAVRNLQFELNSYEKEIVEQKDTIVRLERERDNYSNEATKLAHTVAIRLDEIKLLDMSIFEYRKRLAELELQLKKQQQLYDTGVYDKAILQRALRDTSIEININSEKLRHLNHTLTTLKFQVHEKDLEVQTEASEFERIQKDTTFFANEASRIKLMANHMECAVDSLEIEREILGRTIADAESEISKQNIYANSAASRKQVYHRKLMEKDAELKDIWEKCRVLHSTIRIGAYHFRKIMAEIRQLRYHIFLLKKERIVVKGNAHNIRKLRYEIAVLENCISKETCMCNALREQLKHPINVHRWRILECTNPSNFEKVQKINLLTKRLVERNCSLASQSTDLVSKQQIYVQIRDALKKSPGLESPEDVRYYQHLLAAKNQQYIALKEDLKGSEAQNEYYMEEIQWLSERMAFLKDSYFKRLRALIKSGHTYQHHSVPNQINKPHPVSGRVNHPAKKIIKNQSKLVESELQLNARANYNQEFLGEDDEGIPENEDYELGNYEFENIIANLEQEGENQEDEVEYYENNIASELEDGNSSMRYP